MDLPIPKPSQTGEPDPDSAETATKIAEHSAEEIKEQMLLRIESVQRRAAALKNEATLQGLTLSDQPAPEWVKSHPEKVALAAMGVGAALAIVTGFPGKLRRRREKRRRQEDQSDVLRYYLDAVADDAARRRFVDGDVATSAEGAMHEAIRASGPVIYAPPEPEKTARSSLRQAIDIAFKTALGFAVKAVMDELTQKLTGEDELFEALGDADDGTLAPPAPGVYAATPAAPSFSPPPVPDPAVVAPDVAPPGVPSPS